MHSLRRCGPSLTHTHTHNSNNCQVKSVANPLGTAHTRWAHWVHSPFPWPWQMCNRLETISMGFSHVSFCFFHDGGDDHHRWPKFHASRAKPIAHPHPHTYTHTSTWLHCACNTSSLHWTLAFSRECKGKREVEREREWEMDVVFPFAIPTRTTYHSCSCRVPFELSMLQSYNSTRYYQMGL